MQGFRKVDPDRWEFANEEFLGGQKHLLKNIKRRRNIGQSLPQRHQSSPCLELEQPGQETELQRAKRERAVLMMEILKLRQQQQTSRAQLAEMEERMQCTERKQRQTMAFLAKAMKNPAFIPQLVNRARTNRELGSAGKRRRLPARSSSEEVQESGVTDFAEITEVKQREMLESMDENFGAMTADVIWDELLSEELMGGSGVEEGESSEIEAEEMAAEPSEWVEDVREWVEQMEYLGSKP